MSLLKTIPSCTISPMKAQTFTLPNGLRVVFADTQAFPTLTTLLLVGAGSRYENEQNNGVAHFFEHMAFKGSKKYPNSFVLSSTIEGLGGVFNAFTSKDHTGYYIKATNEHFETIIDVLSDMILNSLLKDKEIEREKGVIVEELNLYEDTPYRKVGELFETLLYHGNPLGYEIGGSKKTVASFTRETFTSYMDRLYHPKNAVLVIAGGLNKVQSTKSKVQNYFKTVEKKLKNWENGKVAEFENVVEDQKAPQILLRSKKTEQTHFCLGFRAYSFSDKRKYQTALLSTLLGGGMSSRLFIEVRERRGLCYYISTGRELYHDVGNFVTSAGVTNNLDKVKQSIEVILKEHKKVTLGKVTKEELRKAKEIIKGRILLSLEDSHNVASFFGTKCLLENEVKTPQEEIERMEKVTLDQIVEVASDIFVAEKLNLALIGPYEKKEDFETVLNV